MIKDLSKKRSYYYKLPPEYIAQYPSNRRSESRLLYLNRSSGKIEHHKFDEIIKYFRSDDILVLNKTKVIPARLFGRKITGAQVEIFLLNQISSSIWECLVRPGRRIPIGTKLEFDRNLKGEITARRNTGTRLIEFFWTGDFWDILENIGKMPLPPYIKRKATEKDKRTYQTVYADEKGSVAAPTAGLHFTEELLTKIVELGVKITWVILHIGLGTFRPVQTEYIADHQMHKEHCQITQETTDVINQAKKEGKRVIAVGTTTTRTLESFAENGSISSGSKWTDLFIHPGKKIQIIDGLITNFHMPESTLLMLVATFAGYENIINAYRVAVEKKYRFFSYGDAMLIL